MSLVSKIGFTAVLAGAALLLYAKNRSDKTGRDIGTVLSNLPDELKETRGELQKEVKIALEAGKRAAAEKEAEIDRQLESEEKAPTVIQDYAV